MDHSPAAELAAEPERGLGQVLVMGPQGGRNYWQPVPANGRISVRVAPDFVTMETPFSIGTQTVPPRGYVREHSHPEHDEVLHFISGTGKAVIDGAEHALAPGTTLFVGRNRRHMFVNTQEEGDLHWLWFIQPAGLEGFFAQIGRPVVAGEPDPTPFPRPDDVLEIERRTAFAPAPADQRRPDFGTEGG